MLRWRITLIALAVTAGALFWFSTAWGIGLSPDSAYYLKSARHMLGREVPGTVWFDQRQGQTSHYPPLYAKALEVASLGGADPQDAARWLHLALFIMNVLVVARIVHRITNAVCASLLAGGFIAFTPHSLVGHAFALSEPLFLTLMLMSFLLLHRYLSTGRRDWLLGAAIATGFTMMTRYAGVALLPTGFFCILLFRRRWIDALIFAFIGVLPMAATAIANRIKSGTAVNREWAFHPISWDHIKEALSTTCQWFFPGQMSQAKLLLGGIVIIAMILIIGITIVRRANANASGVAFLFIICYAATLGGSVTFVDFHTRLDERLLLPLLFASCILVSSFITNKSITVVAVIVVAIAAARGITAARSMHRDGIGYASRSWVNSELIAAAKQLPPDETIFSNGADVVYLLARREASPIPAKTIATSLLPNPDYDRYMEGLQAQLARGHASIIYFRKFQSKRSYYPSDAELQQRLNLRQVLNVSDGAIYRH